MLRPPRARRQRLLTWPLLARAYLFLGVIEAVAGLSAFFFVLFSAGWTYGETIAPGSALHATYWKATTACLAAIVMTQVVNVFLCRSETKSAFPLRENWLLWLGIVIELALMLAISYTSIGNLIFGTAPLDWRVWLFCVPFAGAMLVFEEARKWLMRRQRARRDAPTAECAPPQSGAPAAAQSPDTSATALLPGLPSYGRKPSRSASFRGRYSSIT
jgi:magnesium-transporting ATPase (P-type)